MPLTKVPNELLETPSSGGGASPNDNLFINGRFEIDQRWGGTLADQFYDGSDVATGTGGHGPDRWAGHRVDAASGAWFTFQREADSVNVGEFRLKVGVGGARSSLNAGDSFHMEQRIEGYRCVPLKFGTAGASQITLAFEVEANLTGTFPIAFRNAAKDRCYVTSFTINAANTRETKTITINGDTSGTWLFDNQAGLGVCIAFGVGSTRQTATLNAWQAGNFLSPNSGVTNFMASTGNTMRFRNMRLHKGATDLGIDTRAWADTLALCQRFFWKSFNVEDKPITNYGVSGAGLIVASGNNIPGVLYMSVRFPVQMRKPAGLTSDPFPTYVFWNPSSGSNVNDARNLNNNADCSSTTIQNKGESGVFFTTTTPSGTTINHGIGVNLTASCEYGP